HDPDHDQQSGRRIFSATTTPARNLGRFVEFSGRYRPTNRQADGAASVIRYRSLRTGITAIPAYVQPLPSAYSTRGIPVATTSGNGAGNRQSESLLVQSRLSRQYWSGSSG